MIIARKNSWPIVTGLIIAPKSNAKKPRSEQRKSIKTIGIEPTRNAGVMWDWPEDLTEKGSSQTIEVIHARAGIDILECVSSGQGPTGSGVVRA